MVLGAALQLNQCTGKEPQDASVVDVDGEIQEGDWRDPKTRTRLALGVWETAAQCPGPNPEAELPGPAATMVATQEATGPRNAARTWQQRL